MRANAQLKETSFDLVLSLSDSFPLIKCSGAESIVLKVLYDFLYFVFCFSFRFYL